MKITVDMWATDLHSVNIGIKKQAQHRAKSRQFTQDTDIIGGYQGKYDGYLTIREDPWKAEGKEQRLVMKSFTESMNWKGSLEEMVALGVTRSVATGQGMPVFTVNLANHDHLIMLERVWKPMKLKQIVYSFMFAEDEVLDAYYITEDRLTIGSDWDVFNMHQQRVAKIDGSGFNIGGKWKLTIADDIPVHSKLDEVLVMFAGMLKFEDNVRDRLEKTIDMLKDAPNEKQPVSTEEVYLYDNPRRLKY